MVINIETGIDSIPAELLKPTEAVGHKRLFKLVYKMYMTVHIPTDFKKSIIAPLEKLTKTKMSQ